LFRNWPNKISPEIEVVPIQLPGKEVRMGDPLHSDLAGLVEDLGDAIESLLNVPFAFFGYSLGSMISFELARRIRRKRLGNPVHFFVSARQAPQLPEPNPDIRHLPDDQFVSEVIRRYDGIPKEIVQDPDVLAIFLPILRADIGMIETYTYREEPPFDCPITVFGGEHDREATYDQLAAWQKQTCGTFETRIYPGNHFFLESCEESIIEKISLDLLNSMTLSQRLLKNE
jgi:medium-chain acyl-[acyl-carrier-protein] hydrolase